MYASSSVKYAWKYWPPRFKMLLFLHMKEDYHGSINPCSHILWTVSTIPRWENIFYIYAQIHLPLYSTKAKTYHQKSSFDPLKRETNPVFLYIYLLPNTSFLTQTIILTFWPRMMIIPTVMLQICIGVPLVCRDIFAANVVPLSKPLTRYAGCARKSSSAGRNLKTLLWIHYLQKTATLFQCT